MLRIRSICTVLFCTGKSHEYELLLEDVKKTSQADLIFLQRINPKTGGNAWFTKLVKNANKVENKDYFAASDGVDVIYLKAKTKLKRRPSRLAQSQVTLKTLPTIKDPKNKDFYENLAVYK